MHFFASNGAPGASKVGSLEYLAMGAFAS